MVEATTNTGSTTNTGTNTGTTNTGTTNTGTTNTGTTNTTQTTNGTGTTQTSNEPWFASADYGFDQSTRDFFAGKNYPDVKTALSSLPQADRMARERNVLEKPNPEKLREWKGWEDLGAPADPAKYTIKAPEKDKLKFTYDGELWDAVKKIGHENRIPVAQLQAVHDGVLDLFGKRFEKVEAEGSAELTKLDTALKSEWGADYPQKRELAERAARAQAKALGVEDFSALEHALGGSPNLLKFFAGLGESMGEDTLKGGGGGGAGKLTPSTARQERLRLEANKDWMEIFNDNRHPQNKDYAAHRNRLLAIEAGEK